MLVVGSQPCDYVPLHPADDLARCLRYYEVLGRNGSGSITAGGVATATGQNVRVSIKLVTKPIVPTITKVGGAWNVQNAGQPNVGAADVDGFQFYATSSAAGEFYGQNAAAGSYITAEANP